MIGFGIQAHSQMQGQRTRVFGKGGLELGGGKLVSEIQAHARKDYLH